MKSGKSNLKCPDCNNNLKEVLADTHYGLKIKLDQCFGCGGIWFDDLELYPVKKEEVEKLENADLKKLQENSFLGGGNGLCPICLDKLEIFKDYNFPKQLEVEYCKNCKGLWMNRGEAMDFKIWQESRKSKKEETITEEDRKFQESIRCLLESDRDKNFETIGKIGKILSTPIDRYGSMGFAGNSSYGDGNETEKARQIAVAIMVIIQMLLRLFLRH